MYPKTLAFLGRPDSERDIPLEEWKALYASRVDTDYYEKYYAVRQAMLDVAGSPFTDFE